ncbi:MAG: DNA repair protein RecN [Rikenellaceae bacterium]
MLRRITIDNYALIDHLEMDIDQSLNIITGETGAGKSILLGALGLLLGNKNDGSAIKDNTKSCVIEALFSIEALGLEPLFEQNDWEWDPEVVVRRMISPSGKSRAFVNDMPVQLVELKELGARLIDIHSQHQNQILSDENFRVQALDLLAGNGDLLARFVDSYEKLQALRRSLAAAREVQATARRDEEWLSYQVEELTAAALKEGEDKEAEAQLSILENVDRISEALLQFRQRMDDDNFGALLSLKSSQSEFASLGSTYAPAAEYAERIASILVELRDMNSSIAEECERIESDPAKLQRLSDRLNTIYSLCQKHRAQNLEELICIRDKYAAQLISIVQSDENIDKLKAEIAKQEDVANTIAAKLHKARATVAPKFESEIVGTLQKLGMADVVFTASLTSTPSLTPSGADRVDFLFSANRGVAPQAVERIASGGEISRVMLALKALLASRMKLPTIIFDEIDTGVSGRIADAMGEIIADLALSMQVIDITHLPQVASKGQTHFVVYKRDGRTNITKLSDVERVEQIATMLSGSVITEAAMEQAKILLKKIIITL